jgi:curved DNA-binding protein CbpA/CheY-like chemotaxis protein
MLADALDRQGFVIATESDGTWAVQTLEKRQFDVVILDLLLPGINGYDVVERLRANPRGRSTPVIMISSIYKNEAQRQDALMSHGAAAALEKPVELEGLYETLRAILGDSYPRLRQRTWVDVPLGDSPGGAELADDAQRDEVQLVEHHARHVHNRPSGLATQGSFTERPFGEVLAEMYRWRATGTLLLRKDVVKKVVSFKDGAPQLVKSNLLAECLGRILVREKMISDAECDESLRRMKTTGRMQGTVLIQMGCISPHNLQYALHMQLREKLYDVFRWESGDYQFNAKVTPPPEPVTLDMTCAQLIHEGVRFGYTETRLAAALGDVARQFVHPSADPLFALQDAGLGDEEKNLLLVADGHKTVATLRALGLLPAFEVDLLLFAMKCAQMIVLKPEPISGKPRLTFSEIVGLPKPPPLPPQRNPPPLPARNTGPQAAATAPAPEPEREPEPQSVEPARPPRPPPPPAPTVTSGPPPPPERAAQPRLPPAPPSPPEDLPVPPRRPAIVPEKPGSLLPELSGLHEAAPNSVEVSVSGVERSHLTDEKTVRRERLAATLSSMRKKNYFQLLGITPEADREGVKSAYFTLAKAYHPDRHSNSASTEVRGLAQQIFDLISTAHDVLTNPGDRAAYLQELEAAKPELSAPPERERDAAGQMLAAEGKFQQGEEAMRQRQYPTALQYFLQAIELFPGEGEFHTWKGWALFQCAPSRSDEAIRSIETGIGLSPTLYKNYLFLGYIYKALGRSDRSERQFEKAIQCNPNCTEALRELRLLGKNPR